MVMVVGYTLWPDKSFCCFSSHEGLLTVDEGLGQISQLFFVFHGRKHETGKYAESAPFPFCSLRECQYLEERRVGGVSGQSW